MNRGITLIADFIVERDGPGLHLTCSLAAGEVKQPACNRVQAEALHRKAFFLHLPLRRCHFRERQRTRPDGVAPHFVDGEQVLFHARQAEDDGRAVLHPDIAEALPADAHTEQGAQIVAVPGIAEGRAEFQGADLLVQRQPFLVQPVRQKEADRTLAVRVPAGENQAASGLCFCPAFQLKAFRGRQKVCGSQDAVFLTAALQVFRTPQQVRVFHLSPWCCAPVHSSSSAVLQSAPERPPPRRQTPASWCAARPSAGRRGG